MADYCERHGLSFLTVSVFNSVTRQLLNSSFAYYGACVPGTIGFTFFLVCSMTWPRMGLTKHCDGCSLYNVHIHISGLMHLFLALRKGRLAIGFYEAFHSQIEFLLLPSLLSCLIFLAYISEQIGLDSVEVVSSAFF